MMNVPSGLLSFFLKEKIAGLDIGENHISAAFLSERGDGRVAISNLGMAENKPGSGWRAQASVVRGLWRRTGIKTRTVISCLRSSSLALKHFRFPSLSGAELGSALALEAEHIFQRPKEELFIDWYLYPSSASSQAEVEGIIAAAPMEDVRNHLAIIRAAGLYPVAVDIGCMAVATLFLRLKDPAPEETVCLANVNDHEADIAIISGGNRIYPRSVHSKVGSFMERLDNLFGNIDDLLRYYQFKLRQKPVEKIFYTGGLSSNDRFRKEAVRAVELPVEFWDPFKEPSVKYAHSTSRVSAGPAEAAVLGLAMRDI